MQINRLFEMVYLLLNKQTMTSTQLAKYFGVSTRTIYRDVETLSGAGIPIYMTKGKGGGIHLLDNFVLNKSVLTENEQNEILSALHGLNLLEAEHSDPVLDKLGNLFNRKAIQWIDIDLSYWGSGNEEKDKFQLLKEAILSRNMVTFVYHAPHQEPVTRVVEPLQLYFKEKGWYLKSYCTERQDYRTFKITRIRHITKIDQIFSRELNVEQPEVFSAENKERLVLRFKKIALGRVYDEFEAQSIIYEDKDSVIAEIYCPVDEWILGFILSYGAKVEVLEPRHIRETIKKKLKENLQQYL